MILQNTYEETSMIYMLVFSIAVITLSIGGTLLSGRQPACAVLRQARIGRPRVR